MERHERLGNVGGAGECSRNPLPVCLFLSSPEPLILAGRGKRQRRVSERRTHTIRYHGRPMPLIREMPRWIAGLLTVGIPLLTACGELLVEPGDPDSTTPAQIVSATANGESGIVIRLVLDSATGNYQESCTSTVIACKIGVIGPGHAPRANVDQLFALTRTAEFQTLKDEYDMSATYVDGSAYSFSITANGRTRRIRWSDAAKLPRAITDFRAVFNGITGSGR